MAQQILNALMVFPLGYTLKKTALPSLVVVLILWFVFSKISRICDCMYDRKYISVLKLCIHSMLGIFPTTKASLS